MSSLNLDNKAMPLGIPGAPGSLKPILVSGPEARRLIGVGTTKYHDLLNKGVIESVMVGGRRMIVYASLERLATPTQEAA